MKKLFSSPNKIKNYKERCENSRKGFSLFELIIYIAILSGLMVISSNMFISLSKGHGQSSAKVEVNSAIRFATEILRQDIKNASIVSVPIAVGSDDTLTLTRGGNVIIYDVLGGSLRRKEGDSAAVSLTGPDISVGTPSFTRIENKNLIFNTTNVGIKAEMIFSYNSTSPDWNYSATLKTTTNLMADGVLSFIGSPVSENNLIAETGLKSVATDWSSYDNVYINDGVTVTFESGSHDLGAANLVVNNGGEIIALSSSQIATGATGVTITTTGNITVAAGGHINADSQGYLGAIDNPDPGYGPGGGTYAYWGGGGGSHGGQGGKNTDGGAKASLYGDESSPVLLGSGGGSSIGYCGAPSSGGAGGGAIKLVANVLTNNGTISANATSGEKLGGAGAGGSIWVDVNNLTGSNSGVFSSSGGNLIYITDADERCTGSGGGGGRISLNSSGTDTYAGSIIVAGGDGSQGGEAGTIVRNVTNPGNVIIASGTVTWTRGSHTFNNFTVNAGATLTTGVAQGKSRSIVGNGLGGGATTNYFGASGAGHGGVGGVAQYGGSLAGGISYNSNGLQVSEPTDLGSGGGGAKASNSSGGYGAGAIKIITIGDLINNGNISADGGGTNTSGNLAGGGSGGSLWFVVGGVLSSTNGTFSAKGGAANLANGESRGGGAGGRISFSYGSTSFSGHIITVAGGLGDPSTNPLFNGGDGTINGL